MKTLGIWFDTNCKEPPKMSDKEFQAKVLLFLAKLMADLKVPANSTSAMMLLRLIEDAERDL